MQSDICSKFKKVIWLVSKSTCESNKNISITYVHILGNKFKICWKTNTIKNVYEYIYIYIYMWITFYYVWCSYCCSFTMVKFYCGVVHIMIISNKMMQQLFSSGEQFKKRVLTKAKHFMDVPNHLDKVVLSFHGGMKMVTQVVVVVGVSQSFIDSPFR